MSVIKYNAFQFTGSKNQPVQDDLAIEGPLSISINDEVFTITMRSPGNDEALIRGLLFTEDIYKSKTDNPKIEIVSKDNLNQTLTVNVLVNPELLGDRYLNKRNLLSVASCGICGKTELSTPTANHSSNSSKTQIDADLIPELFKRMNENQGTFKQSGGSHASAAFSPTGELLSLQEDIGRHNAVDKVIGDLLLHQKLNHAKILLVSGRISYEIVSKCFVAGIPVLAAVSAPSSLAVDFAKELGITLIAFCRNEKFTVYSHPDKIKLTHTV